MSEQGRTIGRRHLSGTSLIELLVVIVIFLVGILAVAQIFPGGFRILGLTRQQSMAASLARQQMNLRRGNADQLPEQIIPVIFQNVSGTLLVVADPNRTEDDLGPQGPLIDSNGNVQDGMGQPLGYWPYASGPNNVRRVVGEGNTVPAPRTVTSGSNGFGGLVTLQFGPIGSANVVTPNLLVYGNDMERVEGTPEPPVTGQTVLSYRYFVDDTDPTHPILFIPQDPALTHNYKLSVTAYILNSGTISARDFVAISPIPIGGGGSPDPYQQVDLSTIPGVLGPGDSLAGFDFDSMRLARQFDALNSTQAWDTSVDTTTGQPHNPYQYRLLDASLGLILINPAAYKFVERIDSGRQIPLKARIDYDVFDWRIINEQFRIPGDGAYQYRLQLSNLKHHNGYGADNKFYLGLNIPAPNETGGTDTLRDMIILDLQTGGIYSRTAFTIDYSQGIVTFLDKDNDPTNGLQVGLILPGASFPTTVRADGRAVRVMYEANGEWSAQTLKAASQYSQAQVSPPQPAQYYVLPPAPPVGSNPPTNSDHTIQFPKADANKVVAIDEVWYVYTDQRDSTVHTDVIQGQSFLIHPQGTQPAPFVDFTEQVPSLWRTGDAVGPNHYRSVMGADFSHGYAVKGVKGQSVNVRVLFNTAFMNFTGDNQKNVTTFEDWMHSWHHVNTESVIERGVQ